MSRPASGLKPSIAQSAVAVAIALTFGAGCSNCRSAGSTKAKDGAGTPAVALDAAIIAIGYDPKHPYVVVAVDGSRFAILAPAGGVLTSVNVGSTKDIKIADLDGILVWRDATEAHAIDLQTGREVWKRSFDDGINEVSLGAGRIAVAHASGVKIFELTTGREVYQRASFEARVRHYDGVGFLLADAKSLWCVGDDLAERWSHDLDADTGPIIPASGLVLVIRKKGEYKAFDPSSGVEVAHGTCANGKTVAVTLLRHPLGGSLRGPVRLCAEEPEDGELLAVDEERNELYVVGSYTEQDAKLKLVGRDVVGRVRWTAPWPGLDRRVEVADRDDGTLAALVKPDGMMLVYDVEAGRLLFDRRLAPGDRYAGFSGDCLLISTTRSAICLDKRSGATQWTTEAFGKSAALWPLAAGESLLADGNPMTLSKVDVTGKRAWQIALTGDPILKFPKSRNEWPVLTSGAEEGLAQAAAAWVLSPSMGAQVDGQVTRVLDLQKGEIREIRL